jgi:hypothetical protein
LVTLELDMFVSERYLLTIHDETMPSLQKLLQRAKTDPKLMLEQGIDILLYQVLDRLVDGYQPILDDMQDALDDLEEEAVSDPTPELLPRISQKKRELLNLRRVIGPQRDVLGAAHARGGAVHPGIDADLPAGCAGPSDPGGGDDRAVSRPGDRGAGHLHVEHLQQPQQDHEDADDHHGDRAADDGDHELLRDEFRGCAGVELDAA